MPMWLRRYLAGSPLHVHLIRALVLGLLFRLLAAYFVYGPQALDDYRHGVWPAYQYFIGETPDLPDYRSHLLMWLLAGFIGIGSWLSMDSALAQVRVMYTGLAIVSLTGILGTYAFVKAARSKVFAASALYLVALFPLMPFVSTRAFGEAVALSLVLLGFGILESARQSSPPAKEGLALTWLAGFLALGLATLFRFHVGILFVVYLLCLLWLRLYLAVAMAVLAGVVTLGGQVFIDYISLKPLLGTLVAYIKANEGGAAQYGVSPWYNTWLFVLALTLAPFSFVLVRRVPALWRAHWPWLIPLLSFVLIHSLVPHKEERFLYPIVGLLLWAVAWLWSSQRRNRWVRLIYANVLLGISVVVLPLASLVNTQEGEIEPPAYAESRYQRVVYLDHESLFAISRIQFYFLRPPSLLQKVPREAFNSVQIDETLRAHPDHRAAVLLTSDEKARDTLSTLAGVKTFEAQCGSLRTAGSLIDRLIYSLNPKHNQRRRPTWYLICERG